MRRTKIVATLGPSTDRPDQLEAILRAGVDVVRINFSHGTAAQHAERIRQVRQISQAIGKEVGVLADLQGPKIRIASFTTPVVELKPDQAFVLDVSHPPDAGTVERVGVDYPSLPHQVHTGDTLLLDDGRIALTVSRVQGSSVHCLVEIGGELSGRKGINRLGGGLTAPSLTEKDKQDLKVAVGAGADYIAVSFVSDARDVRDAKALIHEAGGVDVGVIAKIERAEAITHLDDIIAASEGIMVARGDLGVELGDAELPALQKHMIHRARQLNKAVITATQMMESMIERPLPTRAEVSDVANAVLDATDAVMLSAETASGKHPERVVSAMVRIILGAEKHPRTRTSRHRADWVFSRVDEAIAMATMYTANHLNISAIIALTESGTTPLWMSRIRTGIPIFALSRHPRTRHRAALYRNVFPIPFDATQYTRDTLNEAAIDELKKRGCVHPGQLVILTKGDIEGVHGGTNAMKIICVGDAV